MQTTTGELAELIRLLEGAATPGVREDVLQAYREASDLALDAGREDLAYGLRRMAQLGLAPAGDDQGRYAWGVARANEPPGGHLLPAPAMFVTMTLPDFHPLPQFSRASLSAALALALLEKKA